MCIRDRGYVDGTMEPDGFAYDGAAVYDHKDHQYLRIWGNYPDQAAQEDVFHRNTQHSPDTAAQSNVSVSYTHLEIERKEKTYRMKVWRGLHQIIGQMQQVENC